MKHRLFLDTNIMLDLLGERNPFYEPVAKIATLADMDKIQIVASSLSYATVYFILSRFENPEKVKEKLRKFKVISEVSSVNQTIIEKGLNSGFRDFEDSLQYFSALEADCTIIISRDTGDFREAEIPVMTSDEYLRSIKKK